MDCACCGLGLDRPDNYYTEEEEIVCPSCGATNVVFIDDTNHAYFGIWTCKHGVDGDEPCDQCEIEHGVAV